MGIGLNSLFNGIRTGSIDPFTNQVGDRLADALAITFCQITDDLESFLIQVYGGAHVHRMMSGKMMSNQQE